MRIENDFKEYLIEKPCQYISLVKSPNFDAANICVLQ